MEVFTVRLMRLECPTPVIVPNMIILGKLAYLMQSGSLLYKGGVN